MCDDAPTRQYARANERTNDETIEFHTHIYIYTDRARVAVAVARAATPHRVPTRNPYNSPIAFYARATPCIILALTRFHARDVRTRPDMLTVAEFIFQGVVFVVVVVWLRTVVRSRKRASV